MDAGIRSGKTHRVKRHSASYMGNYFDFLLRGDGYYHLYFVVVILQVYILLPFIMYVVSHLT